MLQIPLCRTKPICPITSHAQPRILVVTTDMVSHLGVDGEVLEMTGYTADEFLALDPMNEFLSPKADRIKLTSSFVRLLDPSQSFVEFDIPYVHKDGHTIWLRACHGSRFVGTAANGRSKILAVFRDVTMTLSRETMTETWTEDDSEFRSGAHICDCSSHPIIMLTFDSLRGIEFVRSTSFWIFICIHIMHQDTASSCDTRVAFQKKRHERRVCPHFCASCRCDVCFLSSFTDCECFSWNVESQNGPPQVCTQ